MRRFRFRLEGLLRLRKIREDRCRQQLGERNAEVADIERQLAELISERRDAQTNERREGVLEMTEVLVRQRHLNALKMRAMELSRQRSEVAQSVHMAQKELACARQEREVVERLRERQFEEYQLELDREEQANMDEIARQLHTASGRSDS